MKEGNVQYYDHGLEIWAFIKMSEIVNKMGQIQILYLHIKNSHFLKTYFLTSYKVY